MSFRKNTGFYTLAVLILVGVIFYSFTKSSEVTVAEKTKTTEPKLRFGFDESQYVIESNILGNNQFLGSILQSYGISGKLIADIEKKARGIFDVRNIRAGKPYHIIKSDSCSSDGVAALVYEPAPLKYVVYDFRDSVTVKSVEREYDLCLEEASGTIESSLWNAMVDQGINPMVIDLMEDALAAQVSFYHTQKGDRFKVLYEQKEVDGKPVGLGKMLGAYFENDYGQYYSIFFENDIYGGYYDLDGRPARKSFLRSPIRAGRISSRYNLRRLHPIKRRRIPHLGTDYAAPYGTKIMAVADGVVTVKAFKRNNGRYIKIRHDDTYTTQYLHMQRFAKGVNPGVKVTQGQTIGYVGSSGLATGPHVCFRFWKNGNQIDHLREKFPPAEPMPESDMPRFNKERDAIRYRLDDIPLSPREDTLSAI